VSLRAQSLRVDRAATTGADVLTARRATLWGLLLAKLVGTWGVQWDIQWHVVIGRDTFWIAPHLMTYAGVTLAVLLSWGTLAWETALGGTAPAGAIRVLGLRGTRGFHLAAWGIAVTVLAAPIDDLWHRLFGLDVTLWSPPHLMGIFGSAINSLACLLIAQEVYPRGARARAVAIVGGGALLLGSLYWVVQPAHLTAYAHGGIFFFTPPILSALVLPAALVTTARLSDLRWAPVLTLALTVVVGVAGQQISDVGFAALRPVSVIEEEIRKDPTSPIALATEIARKQGVPPGRTGGLNHAWSLLAVAALAAVDARRRPLGATAAYAAVLFVVSTWLLAGSVAFGPLYPGLTLAAPGLALTLVAGLLGAALARWLSDSLVHGATALVSRP
jgi:hypothetical protein